MNTLALTRKQELQIAPLIDVVFLLLVYFMVTASLVKKEADLSFALPLPLTSPTLTQPLDVVIEISEGGDILMEGVRFADRDALAGRLAQCRSVADASKSELIVSLLPADGAAHEMIVPVMDACAAARVENLSFSVAP